MPLLIDKYLEKYHYHARYERTIKATANHCFQAAKNLDISPSFLIKLLLRLRGLPYKDKSLQYFIRSMCFTYLEEIPDEEFVIDASQPKINIYWNFYFNAISERQTRVSTETRIYCLTQKAKRRFALYWFFVRPFSGLIRKEMLRLIEKKVYQFQ